MLETKTGKKLLDVNVSPFLHIRVHSFFCTEEKKLLENIVEKGEIAQHEQFHLFPPRFPFNLYLKVLL